MRASASREMHRACRTRAEGMRRRYARSFMRESLLRFLPFELSTWHAALSTSETELGGWLVAGGPRRDAGAGAGAGTEVLGIVGFTVLMNLAVFFSLHSRFSYGMPFGPPSENHSRPRYARWVGRSDRLGSLFFRAGHLPRPRSRTRRDVSRSLQSIAAHHSRSELASRSL